MIDSDNLECASMAAERGVLCACLDNKIFLNEISLRLKSHHFTDPKNKLIFETMLDVMVHESVFDMITLVSKMKPSDVEAIGGVAYLAGLSMDLPPTKELLFQYVEILIERYLRSCLVSRCRAYVHNIVSRGTDPCAASLDFISDIKKYISGSDVKNDFSSISDLIDTAQAPVSFISTGISEIDKSIGGGLASGEYTIISGLDGSGKTSLAIELSLRVAMKGYGVAWYSIEMSKADIAKRILSRASGVPYADIRQKHISEMSDQYRLKMENAKPKIRKLSISISDSPYSDIGTIVRGIHRMAAEGFKVVVIDYLQIIQKENGSEFSDSHSSSQWQFFEYASIRLMMAAKDSGMHVIALSQLAKVRDREPNHEDLSGGVRISKPAHTVMILLDNKKGDESRHKRDVTLLVPKSRNGPKGKVSLFFETDIQKWS